MICISKSGNEPLVRRLKGEGRDGREVALSHSWLYFILFSLMAFHGILQARILVGLAISFFRGSSWPRDRTWVFSIVGGLFTTDPLGKTLCLKLSFLEISRHRASFSYYRLKPGEKLSHTLTAFLERFVNFFIGLWVYFKVVTGANAKNILILLASSGLVENAMKAERKENTNSWI